MSRFVAFTPQQFADRFWSRVDASGDCWEWTGYVDVDGYGKVTVRRKPRGVHRVAWELLVGPIADGLQVDHLCRNRVCVNPDHLEPVTPRVNTLRSYAEPAKRSRQTHCKRGHELSGRNLWTNSFGSRVCRACQAQRMARRRREAAA